MKCYLVPVVERLHVVDLLYSSLHLLHHVSCGESKILVVSLQKVFPGLPNRHGDFQEQHLQGEEIEMINVSSWSVCTSSSVVFPRTTRDLNDLHCTRHEKRHPKEGAKAKLLLKANRPIKKGRGRKVEESSFSDSDSDRRCFLLAQFMP